MKNIVSRLLPTTMLCFGFCGIAFSDTIWDYQSVKADGNGSHPLVNAAAYDRNENVLHSNKVTVEGVALAGMNDIWIANSPNPWTNQYSLFLQDDTNDRGGIQIWAGDFGWYQPPVVWRPAQYTAFSAGDRVRVTGFLGDHAGKVFINDRHGNDLDVCFSVEVLGHPGLPQPELIPNVSRCNYFDPNRLEGGERYQTRFVMLHGVQIGNGNWTNNSTLTVSDETGNLDLFLAPRGAFSNSKPTGKVAVVGIFDQEDNGAGNPVQYHSGYRLILKNQTDIAIALNACREVLDRTVGESVAISGKTVTRAYPGYFYVQDIDRSGAIKVVSERLVTPGDIVSVMGAVANDGGTKALLATYVAKSRLPLRALTVNGKTLQGQAGLNVFGLLVKCAGRMGSNLGNGLYQFIDGDGATLTLDSGGFSIPSPGSVVTVTAIAGGDSNAPILLLGSPNDIVVH